ncbi:MAG TPA: PP2C family protein-serine/threonine phosphatase, partial [Kineosporiaceae bacterium]|nr:PP2C family protein-serine/threonine phosphatase [Kineosporiaceae bacterium]
VRDLVEGDAGSGEGPQFATALHAVVELDTGRTRLASAGHPPPLVHRPGEGSRVATVPPGPPLGLGGGHPETEFVLPEGGSLLLFTDGLVEDRSRDLDAGMGELAARLAEQAGPEVAGVLARILDGLRAGEAADDVAVVLVRRDGGPGWAPSQGADEPAHRDG